MIFGSLFSGIGGIDLGLERAGMECIWQVENDKYCTRVLEKHWPEVQRFGDVRECTNLPPVDLVAGGFPCQPHSVAGKRRGAEDDRNLWPEFRRVIAELRPRYVLAENVPGIVTTYIDTVLSDLEGQGYTCATFNLPAVAFDAPHRRERIFIVAHRIGSGSGRGAAIGQSHGQGWQETQAKRKGLQPGDRQAHSGFSQSGGETVSHSQSKRLERHEREVMAGEGEGRQNPNAARSDWWAVEPDVGRVANGVPSRVDRLRGLGNAVVPQVAEWVGEKILEYDRNRKGVLG